MIRGIDILFSIDGNFIACASEADINISTSFLEYTAPVTTKAKNMIPAIVGFRISISGMLSFASRKYMYLKLEAFQKIDFSYQTINAVDGRFHGECWMDSWGETSPSNSFATFNSSFLGEGLPIFVAEIP